MFYASIHVGKAVTKTCITIIVLSLLVSIAFLDVQMRMRNSIVEEMEERISWNVSKRKKTLIQGLDKRGWSYVTKQLEPSVDVKSLAKEAGKLLPSKIQSDIDSGKEELRRRLPRAIIIGVKKGGTRALLEILRLHPDVVAPGPEIHFFDRHYGKGLQWYRLQMPLSTGNQLTMEKTPSYFVTPGAPQRVANMSKDLLLLLVTRDPVTRALSDYAQASSKRLQDTRSFEDMAFRNSSTGLVDPDWTGIKIGQYAKHLERWIRHFPLSQIHVVSGEKLVEDPVAEMQAVQRFLKIPTYIGPQHFFFNQSKGFPCLRKTSKNDVPHCLGKTKGRSHPQVAPAALQRLRDFFRPFNQKFYRMVGRDFEWL